MRLTKSSSDKAFDPVDIALVLAGFLVIALIGYFVVSKISGSAKNTALNKVSASASTTSSPSYTVLSPATVPSKAAECTEPITLASNGNSGPVRCSNGDLNATEWNTLATLEPSVLSLGYSATASQVQTALCNDVKVTQSDANTNNASAIEGTVYQIASLYYGWSFSPDPSTVLSQGSC
jgi:hypothetical protein